MKRLLSWVLMSIVFVILMTAQAFAQAAGVELPVEVAPTTLAIVFGCLLAISEVLASIPSLKANSIFQIVEMVLAAIYNSIKK